MTTNNINFRLYYSTYFQFSKQVQFLNIQIIYAKYILSICLFFLMKKSLYFCRTNLKKYKIMAKRNKFYFEQLCFNIALAASIKNNLHLLQHQDEILNIIKDSVAFSIDLIKNMGYTDKEIDRQLVFVSNRLTKVEIAWGIQQYYNIIEGMKSV